MIFDGYIVPVAMTLTLPQKKFELVGGVLCLDFCNTVGGKRGVVARENLHSYLDFLSWSQQACLVDLRTTRGLTREAASRPIEATAVLARAIELREAIYRIFLSVSLHKPASNADLVTLNGELARTHGRLRVSRLKAPPGFGWAWEADEHALDAPLGPLARSAAELLTAPLQLQQVRQCNGENCGWLFIDSSKNHSRRWCDMGDCGNRAKVRRHRLKQRRSE